MQPTNALKHFINQLEKRILQIDQSKNASKHLQYHIGRVQQTQLLRSESVNARCYWMIKKNTPIVANAHRSPFEVRVRIGLGRS